MPAIADVMRAEIVATVEGKSADIYYFKHNGNDCYVVEKWGYTGLTISCIKKGN